MKLSISTWCYNNLSREEAFKKVASFGVEGVEIIAHRPPLHVDVKFTDEQVGYVKGLLTAHGLKISAISPANDFLQFEEESMKAQIQHIHRVVDLCVKLRVDHTRIFAGGRFPEDRTRQECVDAVVYGLRESAKYAEDQGVRLSVENHGQFGRDYELFKAVMDAVPDVGITLHTDGIARMAEDYLGMVEYFAPRIIHTHLNDSVSVGEAFEARSLGEGSLDFPAIFKILKDAGYSGYYNVEYGPRFSGGDPTPLVEKSLDYLRTVLC